MLFGILASLGIILLVVGGYMVYKTLKTPKNQLLIFQFGRFTNSRAGLKGHEYWEDEPNTVEFVDFKYWFRIRPNFGFNLPLIGYYSRAQGKRRRF